MKPTAVIAIGCQGQPTRFTGLLILGHRGRLVVRATGGHGSRGCLLDQVVVAASEPEHQDPHRAKQQQREPHPPSSPQIETDDQQESCEDNGPRHDPWASMKPRTAAMCRNTSH